MPKIVFNKTNRVYNEHSLDVSHMNEQQARSLLSMLRSGQDLNGNKRRWAFLGEEIHFSKDITGRIV